MHALEPGCTLTLEPDHRAVIRKYYSFPSPRDVAASPESVRNALASAIDSHMVADVNVGAFLSGGLDSSAVVAVAAQFAPRITTCSIRFAERSADESAYARAVARHFDTDHHEVTVTANDVIENIDHMIAAIDQPSIDGFNTYFIPQAAADIGLKVVLSGLGGDELFGGYPTFRGVPRVMRAVAAARALGPRVAARAISSLARTDRWRKIAAAVKRPSSAESAYLAYRGLFTVDEAAALSAVSPFNTHDHIGQRAQGDGRDRPLRPSIAQRAVHCGKDDVVVLIRCYFFSRHRIFHIKSAAPKMRSHQPAHGRSLPRSGFG